LHSAAIDINPSFGAALSTRKTAISRAEFVVALGRIRAEEVELHAGDWVTERGMIHSMRTIGDEPVVLLIAGYTEASQALVQCVEGTPTT
jgi:hypothetical protein